MKISNNRDWSKSAGENAMQNTLIRKLLYYKLSAKYVV